MAVYPRMEKRNVHVYDTAEETGTYRLISCFYCPGVVETMCVLYSGRQHYDVLKLKPRVMPGNGDVVAV